MEKATALLHTVMSDNPSFIYYCSKKLTGYTSEEKAKKAANELNDELINKVLKPIEEIGGLSQGQLTEIRNCLFRPFYVVDIIIDNG